MRHEVFKTPSFTRHTLGVAISTVLLAALNTASADGLVPVDGPMGTALVGGDASVPVIDIVAPNAQGLSHNRWRDYNVDAAGLVLNNSLATGQAQVGGQGLALGANAQFAGVAARTILNEVVGPRDSSIQGEQVIFGQAADYVLSNPNGIVLNGARMTLDPAKTATYVVGTLELDDGQIMRFDTRAPLVAGQHLMVGQAGLDIGAGSVQLIAPTFHKNGNITAGGKLTLLLGQHLADLQSLETREVVRSAAPVDARLLGAMHANRIKIVSTDEGVGLNMDITELRGSQGIDIASAGALSISSAGVTEGQHVQAAIDAGGHDLVLSAGGDMTLTSVAVDAQNIDARATGRLKLDALSNQTDTQRQAGDTEGWFTLAPDESQAQITERTLSHVGNRLNAARNVRLDGRDGIDMAATRIRGPEHVEMYTVRGGLRAGAKVDSRWRTVTLPAVDGIEDSAWLYAETAQATHIEGGSVMLPSASLVGTTISASHSIYLSGQADTHIGGLDLKDTSRQGAGVRRVTLTNKRAHETLREDTYQVQSRLQAPNGSLMIRGTDIGIVGSSLSARDISLHSNGTISIEGAGETMRLEGARPGAHQVQKSFDRSAASHTASIVSGSDSLSLQARRSAFRDGNISVTGSHLNAGKALTLDAQDNVWVSGALENASFKLNGPQWRPVAGQSQGDAWKRKGFQESWARSTFGAGSMDVTAGGMLDLAGMSLDSTGNIKLKAVDIQLTGSLEPTGPRNQAVWLDNDLPGYYFRPADDQEYAQVTDRVHNGFSMKAGGDIDITATRLATHAASVNAAGRLTVPASLALFKDTAVEDGDAIRNNYHGYIAPRQSSWHALASLPVATLDTAPPSTNGTTRSSQFVAGAVNADTAQRIKDLHIPLTLR